jgi:ribosomal protein L11
MINDIGGTNFDTLQLYAEMTGSKQDDQVIEKLNQQILAAVPDSTPEEVGQAIDRIKTANPGQTMDEVFAAAVKELNPGCDTDKINQIRSSWQEFTGVSNLSTDDIGKVLTNPAEYIVNNPDSTEKTIKNTMAMLMLLMVEIAGEESANQLLEGFAQRDEVMSIAKAKADDIRAKAIVSLVMGLVSAGVQIGTSAAAMGIASKGFNATKAGDTALANLYGAKSQALSGFSQAGAGVCSTLGGTISGMFDAEIAIKDGESQVANIHKETSDKLRQKASELIQNCISMLQSMSQADYQTMTAIGRV